MWLWYHISCEQNLQRSKVYKTLGGGRYFLEHPERTRMHSNCWLDIPFDVSSAAVAYSTKSEEGMWRILYAMGAYNCQMPFSYFRFLLLACPPHSLSSRQVRCVHVSAILLQVYRGCVITLHQISFGWGLSFSSKKPLSLACSRFCDTCGIGFGKLAYVLCPSMSILMSIKGWGENSYHKTRCNFFRGLYLPI